MGYLLSKKVTGAKIRKNIDNTLDKSSLIKKLDHMSLNRKSCTHFIGCSFKPTVLQLDQEGCFDDVWVMFKYDLISGQK
jgi:hypothetical protein